MLVLGLQGSPRKKGNTEFLLSLFLEEARKYGAQTHMVNVCQKHIEPCKEFTTCEKKGFCPIQDDMDPEIYPLLRKADVVVPASPVFFYNVTAQLKALIDRSQTLWARNYRLKLTDPKRGIRRGFMLSQGATKGKNLFLGVDLTAKYFFDAVGARYSGSLYYWQIEHRGDMERHPSVRGDVAAAVGDLLKPYVGRRKILFAGGRGSARNQMAGAFAQMLGGEKIDALIGCDRPAEKIDPLMEAVMAEKRIDMGFRIPESIDTALEAGPPDMIVAMGCGDIPSAPNAVRVDWDLPDPEGLDIEAMRSLRDEIEKRVSDLIGQLKS
ncbi:NAD(P)H-dependent oxidoreductase [Desulfococcus sp.]|uniref:NAD(P)H-dependent oxidoreductase n=1 Tax=Desulfococcus sp. TaxID=2025834 RepID=UPI0035941F27